MRLRHRLLRFARDDRGSMAVEAMLILPILVWAYLATFVFFDGYRAQSLNTKAAYTIGDILSRETNWVTPAYLDSLFALQQVLTQSDQPRSMRITVIRWNATARRYEVVWSRVRGSGAQQLVTNDLAKLAPFLPVMPAGESAILTETWVDYRPPASVIAPFTFRDFVVTRPRFASQLCWNDRNTGGTMATGIC
ncbi:hypothetical protein ruthe_01330 [Rubellimicrobium thermophilum DSM 16684]|uniref:TadE-like protein n=1 Tax=Rubellimicrobium thermophilum DSM 16684 TaxID=1123069 RepID=S9S8N1_9RHOB|nr:hypothetical protein [Rubellimicrobium thermophilum]EPX86515.1 hypothetical protein ruthe_01330 [Rubellimicrobium thermophilum DSM 16684]